MTILTLPLDNPGLPVLYFCSSLRDTTVSLAKVLHAGDTIPFTSGHRLNREMALALCTGLATLYLLTVRVLRYRRVNALQKRFGYTYTQFQVIDYKDAQSILGNLFLLECPWIFLTGKDFAFLRAFAIPSISQVSVGAKEMVDRAGKRYADTTVLVGEWIVNPLDSERARLALNRVNYIHSRYGNKIRDDQMVYTLCLLISEALRWIDDYDWRNTTALEQHASYVYWKEVGIRMGIAERLIPDSYAACAEYILQFEAKEMGPDMANQRIAQAVLRLYNSTIPSFLRPLFTNVIISFMDDALLNAFALPTVPHILQSLINIALHSRAFFIRNFLLPRFIMPKTFLPKNVSGTYSLAFSEIEPWYIPRTIGNTWGPSAMYARIFGLPLAGTAQWKSDGYTIETIGPGKWDGRGGDEVLEVVQRGNEGVGCPYSTFGWVKDESSLGGIWARGESIAKTPLDMSCPFPNMAQID